MFAKVDKNLNSCESLGINKVKGATPDPSIKRGNKNRG
jgi:hypothetical protein